MIPIMLPSPDAISAVYAAADNRGTLAATAAWHGAVGVVTALCLAAQADHSATVSYLRGYCLQCFGDTADYVADVLRPAVNTLLAPGERGPHENRWLLGKDGRIQTATNGFDGSPVPGAVMSGIHIWAADLARAAAVIACSLSGLITPTDDIQEQIRTWWRQEDAGRIPIWPGSATDLQQAVGIDPLRARLRAWQGNGRTWTQLASILKASPETVRSWAGGRRTPDPVWRTRLERALSESGY